MRRAEPVDPAHALRQACRTPRQIVVHDALSVLEIQSFAQEVGSDQDIRLKRGDRLRSTLRSRREGAQDLLPRDVARREASDVSKHGGGAPVTKTLQQVSRGRLRIGEDDGLGTGGPHREQPLERVDFRIAGRRTCEQLAQARENLAIIGEWRGAVRRVLEQQRKQHQLNVGLSGTREAALELAWR